MAAAVAAMATATTLVLLLLLLQLLQLLQMLQLLCSRPREHRDAPSHLLDEPQHRDGEAPQTCSNPSHYIETVRPHHTQSLAERTATKPESLGPSLSSR